MSDSRKLWKLFLKTLYLSAFTFGGGYVILSLMETDFVKKEKWINKEEMLDIVAIAQSSPGPIAINSAVSIGYKLFGVLGILVAILGTAIPPLVIISIISFFYNSFISNRYIALALKGMQAGVGALVISVVIDMAKEVIYRKGILTLVITLGTVVLNLFFSIKVIYIILGLVLFGIVCSLVKKIESSNVNHL